MLIQLLSKSIQFFEKMKRRRIISLPHLKNVYLHHFPETLILSEKIPSKAESPV